MADCAKNWKRGMENYCMIYPEEREAAFARLAPKAYSDRPYEEGCLERECRNKARSNREPSGKKSGAQEWIKGQGISVAVCRRLNSYKKR